MENVNIDPQLFRRVMGHFATGITVVATKDKNGRPCGLTVNAFTSVSLDPPLVLVCIEKNGETHQPLCEAQHFSINFLSAEQQHISQKFATRGIDRFEGIEWVPGQTGSPLLNGTLGFIECSRYELFPGGDHTIIVGKVEHLLVNGGEPLLYFGSQYRWLRSKDE